MSFIVSMLITLIVFIVGSVYPGVVPSSWEGSPFLHFGDMTNFARIRVMGTHQNWKGTYQPDQNLIVHGVFSPWGSTEPAEGAFIQMHPHALCSRFRFDGANYDYGWVGFVKIESRVSLSHLPRKCRSVYEMARYAIERGATALLVDVNDAEYFQETKPPTEQPKSMLGRPLIFVDPNEGVKLIQFMDHRRTGAHARIEALQVDTTLSGHKEVVLFLTCFLILGLVCCAVVLKMKWRRRNKQNTLIQDATKALSKMECRKYKGKRDRRVKLRVKFKKKRKNRRKKHISTSTHQESNKNKNNNKKNRITEEEVEEEGDDNEDDDTDDGDDEDSQEITVVSDSSEMCVICLEEYRPSQDIRLLPCSHEFHKTCVDPWLVQHRTCPLCNYNIVDCCYEIPQLVSPPSPRTMASTNVYASPSSSYHDNYTNRHSGCVANESQELNRNTQSISHHLSHSQMCSRNYLHEYQHPFRSQDIGHPWERCSIGENAASAFPYYTKVSENSRQSGFHFHPPNNPPEIDVSSSLARHICGFGCPLGCGHDGTNLRNSCLMYPPFTALHQSAWVSSSTSTTHHQPQGSSSEEVENHTFNTEVEHHSSHSHYPPTFPSVENRRGPLPFSPTDKSQLEPFLAALAAIKVQRCSPSSSSSASLSGASCEGRPPSVNRCSLSNITLKYVASNEDPIQQIPVSGHTQEISRLTSFSGELRQEPTESYIQFLSGSNSKNRKKSDV